SHPRSAADREMSSPTVAKAFARRADYPCCLAAHTLARRAQSTLCHPYLPLMSLLTFPFRLRVDGLQRGAARYCTSNAPMSVPSPPLAFATALSTVRGKPIPRWSVVLSRHRTCVLLGL